MAYSTYSGSSSYTCMGCGMYVAGGATHSCPSVYYPASTSTASTGTSSLKHINWQMYTPAVPPVTEKDALIIFIDNYGIKQVERARFRITSAYAYEWYDPKTLMVFTNTVTYYAMIDLP